MKELVNEFNILMDRVFNIFPERNAEEARCERVMSGIYVILFPVPGENGPNRKLMTLRDAIRAYEADFPPDDPITPYTGEELNVIDDLYSFIKENWVEINANLESFQNVFKRFARFNERRGGSRRKTRRSKGRGKKAKRTRRS